YKDAWGKPVWHKNLTKKEKEISLAKHTNFYLVVEALIAKLEDLFKACVVYDIHSYNYKRHDRNVPVFNVGTENIDNKKYAVVKKAFLQSLSEITLPNIKNT